MVSRLAQEELRRLRDDVALLGRRLRSVLPTVTEIFVGADQTGARTFRESGGAMRDEALRIEEACVGFLALHSPVAAELRHAIAVVRIVPELSRSADLMSNVCRSAILLDGRGLPAELGGLVHQMSEQADKLLGAAVEAYETQVLALADAVADMDDHLDELHRQFIRRVIEARRADEIDMETAVQLAMVARFYERIGDHAVNVATIVGFEIEGEMPLVAAAEAQIASDL